MNRRFFGKKAGGVLAGFGAMLGVPLATRASRVSTKHGTLFQATRCLRDYTGEIVSYKFEESSEPILIEQKWDFLVCRVRFRDGRIETRRAPGVNEYYVDLFDHERYNEDSSTMSYGGFYFVGSRIHATKNTIEFIMKGSQEFFRNGAIS